MYRDFTLFENLIQTSADDCRMSLRLRNDVEALRGVLSELDRKGMEKRTHRKHIERRIRQLEKEAECNR